MQYRVTDSSSGGRLTDQIGVARKRVALYQERLSSGKRVNRPSDDPGAAGAILRIRTTNDAIDRFQKGTSAATAGLNLADGALDTYETTLDRARALTTNGLSPTLTQTARDAIATELDGIRTNMLSIANTQSEDGYVFGGTRQGVPPFDPTTGAAAAAPTSAQTLQLEPNANPTVVSVTADRVFADGTGSVFDALSAVSLALRGTGNPAADDATIRATITRLGDLSVVANTARTDVGAGLEATQAAGARLSSATLTNAQLLDSTEAADFAETAVSLTQSQQSLDALLQSSSTITHRRTLIDLLG